MKFCGGACRFDCSRQQLLRNSVHQLPLALSSTGLTPFSSCVYIALGSSACLMASCHLIESKGLILLAMANGDNGRCVFPLTGLQIGDLQSYLSHLSLFMASDSRKFYILVDNGPWLKDLVSRPTHLWQLMVTKSRLSPFANTKRRQDRNMIGELSDLETSPSLNSSKLKNFKEWCSLVDAVTLSRKRALSPVKKLRNSLIANSKLHRTLYGFIVFEVAWRDVRGINYLNELQTDTSLAIEAKVMRRWEFDSIAQAAESISVWFPGSPKEKSLLKEHLDAAIGEVFHDAQESFPRSNKTDIGNIASGTSVQADSPCSSSSSFSMYPATMESMMHRLCTPPPADGPYKRRKLMSPVHFDLGISSDEADSETADILSHAPDISDCKETLQPSLNRDVLILFRFDDRDLPFKLRDIIMSDLRLLTLLEAGLPSWVIFLQSYPVFCHLYRPWMCPLVRVCYVLISIVTVLIGFYDLYKNVPLLKATASRLFGPLFDWIETLEMISRIKYLGTMLFLHNSQKAVKWFLSVTRTVRSFLTLVLEPMTGPFAEFLEFFLPLWSMFIEVAESLVSVTWMVVGSCFTMAGDLVEILLLPLWYILALVWNIATSVIYPIFWILWEILYAPIRLVLGFCSLVAYFCTLSYELIGDLLLFASSLFNFTRDVESTVSAYEVSVWRSLWNDLFSQIFRALRSILNGFVAFFTTCNRHRLSTYNHIKELHHRLSRRPRRAGGEKTGQDVHTAKAQVTPRGRGRSTPLTRLSPGTVR
ncbi:G1/S-specific cyclin-E protein [Perilla frutescens var. frutescens]|nr:G1/S-specific cyclin-E protein [Perilla frutescens var. frutescens]